MVTAAPATIALPHARIAQGVRIAQTRRGVLLVDAVVGTVLLGIALAVMLGLANRALTAQSQGEELQTAAMLIDEQLALVVARGPDNYSKRFPIDAQCPAPFANYRYTLRITGGLGGDPYLVSCTVSWMSGSRERSETIETLVAPRTGDDPDPERKPSERVYREQ